MKAFAGEYKDVNVYVQTEGHYDSGEWIAGSYLDPIPDKMTPRPVTPTQEKRLPEGKYKAGDMKFYVDGQAKYKSGDQIEYQGIKYDIGDISDRPEGNFTIYMGKRIYDSN